MGGCLRRAGVPQPPPAAGEGPRRGVPSPLTYPGLLSACRPCGGGSPSPAGLSAAAHRPPLSTLLLLLLPFLPVGCLEQGSPAVAQLCGPGRPCACGDGVFLCALFCSWVRFLFTFSDFVNYCAVKMLKLGMASFK